MQVRVQNKGKSVRKSRYDGDVSIAYLLIHVLAIIVAIIDLTILCLVRLIHLCTNMRLILLKYHQIYL